MDDVQLHWLQQNQQRLRSQATGLGAIGPFAADVCARAARQAERQHRVAATLAECGALELLEQVSVVDVRAGVLVLEVAEPALMYQLRLRWEQWLTEAVRTQLADIGVVSVRFTTSRPPAPTAPQAERDMRRHG